MTPSALTSLSKYNETYEEGVGDFVIFSELHTIFIFQPCQGPAVGGYRPNLQTSQVKSNPNAVRSNPNSNRRQQGKSSSHKASQGEISTANVDRGREAESSPGIRRRQTRPRRTRHRRTAAMTPVHRTRKAALQYKMDSQVTCPSWRMSFQATCQRRPQR